MPIMSAPLFKNLTQLSTYISSSEHEIGYAVDFTKPYVDIRSQFLQRSLSPLSHASLSWATGAIQGAGGGMGSADMGYEKGKADFLKYTECVVKMIKVCIQTIRFRHACASYGTIHDGNMTAECAFGLTSLCIAL
jgi:exocyst complex protein 7